MTDFQYRNQTEGQPRLEEGVFQPGRAEIAEVMECRLELADEDDDSSSPDRW